MKKAHIVFVMEHEGKYHAIADSIRSGENLIPFINRYHAITAHLCETATEAHQTAEAWNRQFVNNGTSIY
jgi:hypothetical protein